MTFCVTAMLIAAIAAPALALDQVINYEEPQLDFLSNYTVKNATKKLNTSIVISSGGASTFPLCFEGDLNTTVDVSGMKLLVIHLLEKQSDGTYVDTTSNVVFEDYVEVSVSNDHDDALFNTYLESDEFKALYEKDSAYWNSFEEFKESYRTIGPTEFYMITGIDPGFTGFDTGSSVKFKKPGVYIVTPKNQITSSKGSDEEYTAVLFISGSAATITATPTASKVLVNGKETAFDAYNIGGNNYLKLRDVATVVSGSAKQFEVRWNAEKKGIDLMSAQAYTAVGGEMAKGDGTAKSAVANNAPIYLNGTTLSLTAYTIGGNNYFKLRDLGQTFDFDVSWDTAHHAVAIDTAASYTAD